MPSVRQLVPGFFDALEGDRKGGLQLLREERDPKLLEEPSEVRQPPVDPAGRTIGLGPQSVAPPPDGDLLRMTLHKSGIQEVSLKEELDVLDKYVEIERTRFGNRLTIDMQVQPETLDAQVPNLVLQPLVENAIRHGIAPNARPGWIAVHAERDDDELVLQVLDNGDGLPPDRLMALNRGVGLDNTRARLEHLYRDRFEFAFSNLERGLCVTIRIPFEIQAPAGGVVGAA